jgi:hypothetical protein
MVIDIVNVQSLAVRETKNHSPVSPNGHCPESFKRAFERMQAEPWQVQIRNVTRGIQAGKKVTQLFHMFAVHTARVIALIKASQALVADRTNHFLSVTRYITRVKEVTHGVDDVRQWGRLSESF